MLHWLRHTLNNTKQKMVILAMKPKCPPAAITMGPPSNSVIINIKKARLGTTQR